MTRVFLGLGSNKGDRIAFLQSAAREIASLPRTSIEQTSAVYETEPYGVQDQADFLNAVIEIRTELSPEEVFRKTKEIESRLGRSEAVRWGPREIDIDLLFYGSIVLSNLKLTVPHPGASLRRFVLEPLAEIVQDFRDPRSGLLVSELLKQCPDKGSVRRTTFSIL